MVAVYQYMRGKRDLRQRPRHGPGDSGGTVPEVGAVYLRASGVFSEKLRSWLCWGCSKAGRKLRSFGRAAFYPSRAIGEPSQKSDGGLVRFCKFVHQASAFPYLITVPVHDEARIITKMFLIGELG